jgi:outer membrane biosynthesis protein TonB
MNKKSLLIAALAGVALTVNAFAYTPQDSAASMPRPIASSVVKPTRLPHTFSGGVVNVEFSLDQAGQPRDIKVLQVSDPVLKARLVAAFSQWRFEKGATGENAPKRFILPIEVRLDV